MVTPLLIQAILFCQPSSTAAKLGSYLESGFSDGTSNTIAAVERYFQSYQVKNSEGPIQVRCHYSYQISHYQNSPPFETAWSPDRRATFADRGNREEVYPITFTIGTEIISRSSVATGITFQVKPRLDQAWSGVPQTPFSGGLPTLLFDGSVRTLSPSIDERVFWGAVTRDKGEILADW